MQHFALYLLLCGLTIASPGPGVLLTITNALQLQLRLRGALPGILGVVLGILLVAILASTALGALVSSSPRTLQGLQLVGALYLGWLGLRRLRSPAAQGPRPKAGSLPPLGLRSAVADTSCRACWCPSPTPS